MERSCWVLFHEHHYEQAKIHYDPYFVPIPSDKKIKGREESH